MTQVVRAPDERFTALPDFPWSPLYHEWDGVRLARVEAGAGPDVLFLHGEPTWSFLWRHVMPPILEAGYRCIAPDLPGFGRSDKPTDLGWYSYDRHTAAAASFLEAADVRDATIVVHDWGGAVGLRLAVEHPDRISRIVMLDTGLFTGHQKMTDAWSAFRDVRAEHRGPADLDARQRRDAARPGARRARGLRRALPRPGVKGRRTRLPAADPADPRGAGCGRRPARARGARGRHAPDADAVGRPGPDHHAGDRPALRRARSIAPSRR